MKYNNSIKPEDALTAYLAKKSMKLTKQRHLIVKEFFQVDEHMSAEDLYQRVRIIDPSIGQATVYRTLNLLREAGLARELRFSNDITIFEPLADATHHDHLVCEACGKTIAVLDEIIEQLQDRLAEKHGFTLTSHRMYLYGICPECRSANKTPPAKV
ncbi:MAG: transcriptional repressor [Deltaproteobacteria bacterium]|jgi:Fur family ferric uptake transcriptional regulator|nr:transcriptional repressor [Deltaproteobacteria bacterium]